MGLDEVIRRRRMCRDFTEQPVWPGVVDRILDRARRAPSAGNTQGWRFLLLSGPAETGQFWAANADPDWLAAPSLPGLVKAPVVVVPWCSEAAYRRRYSETDKARASGSSDWEVPYWLVDVAFATMLLLLGAEAEGLGALFFRLRPGAPGRLASAFGVPSEWSPIGAVAIGWPAPDGRKPSASAARGRQPLSEVVRRGSWAGPR